MNTSVEKRLLWYVSHQNR